MNDFKEGDTVILPGFPGKYVVSTIKSNQIWVIGNNETFVFSHWFIKEI